MIHKSILTQEVMDLIKPQGGHVYFDGTFGAGGHTKTILELSSPTGKVVAVDKDDSVSGQVSSIKKQFPRRLRFENMGYEDIRSLKMLFDGALLDLGLSSDQLDNSGRGFTYKNNEPLDMRFQLDGRQSVKDILRSGSYDYLARIFREYGEDRKAGLLAKKIIERRRTNPIITTEDLVEVIGTKDKKVLGRLFAALRIAVNDELGVLKNGLENIVECLSIGSVLAVISFHSGEDRIVKNFFRSREDIEVLTKKPIIPSLNEQQLNPRSHSAKLRAGRIIAK